MDRGVYYGLHSDSPVNGPPQGCDPRYKQNWPIEKCVYSATTARIRTSLKETHIGGAHKIDVASILRYTLRAGRIGRLRGFHLSATYSDPHI